MGSRNPLEKPYPHPLRLFSRPSRVPCRRCAGSRSLRLPPSRPAACPAKWGMKLAFYSCRVQEEGGIKRKSRMKGEKEKKKAD